MKAERRLAVTRMCAAASVSRAGYYRHDRDIDWAAEDGDLRDAVQKIAEEWPCYGSRRIGQVLRMQGRSVNRKRVQRLMREGDLLCRQRRAYIATTDSNHGLAIYPNLAGKMVLSGVNQLWVADITYIRLEREFVYLAVVLDAFSRRVVGWALERAIDSDLTVAALQRALANRCPPVGFTHHSDRGVQYASDRYIALLVEHGATISMSRKGNPYDNAKAESFMKTFKYEEVHRTEYRDLQHARACIQTFLERVYNSRRLHSALGYRSPDQFERHLPAHAPKEAASRQLPS